MKILVVCQFYYPENFTITKIAEHLASVGHDVTVLTGKPNYGYGYILPEYKNVKFEVINGVKVHRVNLIPRKKSRLSIIHNYLSFWSNSKKWIRNCKEKYDVVYSMSLSPVTILSAGNLYKKLHKVPHVVHCVDLWPESTLITHAVKKDSIFYKILYKWSKKLYLGADKILIGSPSFKEYFQNVLNIKTDHITFVPQPSLIESSDIEPYNFGDGFNVLYCGNLGIIQLINLIPETMKHLKETNIKFHVIGMGPKTDELLSLIKEYSLEDKVIYHGPIPAKKAVSYFKGADALYISLKSEGYVGKTLPNKLMMSMAFGKPIIGVLGGDGKAAILEANGGYISSEDPREIAKTIENMSKLDAETRNKLGSNNQVYYQNNYSQSRVGELVDLALKEF